MARKPAGLKTVAFEDIRLKAGDTLQMQQIGALDQSHYTVRYIGALRDASLLTTVPLIDQEGMWLRPFSRYIFRTLAGSHVYAFVCQVVKARAHPYPYAHFSYPDSVEARRVRDSPRVNLRLASEAELAGDLLVPVTLLDLSRHGALVEADYPLGGAGATLRIELPIYLAEVNRKLVLNALIRNRIEAQPPRYGLEFQGLADDDALLLHFFIDHLVAEGQDS
jgi:hypothetical protein